MDIPSGLIAAFPPSAHLLLDRARQAMDDSMLLEIAQADYGYMANEMMAELRSIRDKGIIPDVVRWQLREVLALTRWCNPEVPNRPPFEPGPTGRRGHQIRLFVCTLLLRAHAEQPDNIDLSVDSSLAHCLASAQILGDEMSVAAARFLTWLIPRTWSWSEPLLFPLALLSLSTRLRAGRISDADLGEAADWMLAEEARWRQILGPNYPLDPRPSPLSVSSGFWLSLAAELHREAETISTEDVRTKLQVCWLIVEP